MSDSRIDANRIGMMGMSQGAWISLMAAEQSEHISFVIWLSGPPMTPAEQGIAMLRMKIKRKAREKVAIAEAIALSLEEWLGEIGILAADQ